MYVPSDCVRMVVVGTGTSWSTWCEVLWSVFSDGVGTDVGVVVILLTPVVGGVAGPPTYIRTSFVDSLDCHITP